MAFSKLHKKAEAKIKELQKENSRIIERSVGLEMENTLLKSRCERMETALHACSHNIYNTASLDRIICEAIKGR